MEMLIVMSNNNNGEASFKSIARSNRDYPIFVFEDYQAFLVRLWREKIVSKISEVLMA